MGYTMAYTQTRDLTPEEWTELHTMIVSILGHFATEVSVPGGAWLQGIECFMDDDQLTINGKGSGWACEPFRFFREPITNPHSTYRLDWTKKMNEACMNMYSDTPGNKYLTPDGEHVASLWRLYNPGPEEAPWFCNMVKTNFLPYDLVGKAVLAVLYTRFPGSLILSDGEDDASEAEQVWRVPVEWAKAALPAHAFVPNLGRRFPVRMWDKVRSYVLTVQPAIRA